MSAPRRRRRQRGQKLGKGFRARDETVAAALVVARLRLRRSARPDSMAAREPGASAEPAHVQEEVDDIWQLEGHIARVLRTWLREAERSGQSGDEYGVAVLWGRFYDLLVLVDELDAVPFRELEHRRWAALERARRSRPRDRSRSRDLITHAPSTPGRDHSRSPPSQEDRQPPSQEDRQPIADTVVEDWLFLAQEDRTAQVRLPIQG